MFVITSVPLPTAPNLLRLSKSDGVFWITCSDLSSSLYAWCSQWAQPIAWHFVCWHVHTKKTKSDLFCWLNPFRELGMVTMIAMWTFEPYSLFKLLSVPACSHRTSFFYCCCPLWCNNTSITKGLPPLFPIRVYPPLNCSTMHPSPSRVRGQIVDYNLHVWSNSLGEKRLYSISQNFLLTSSTFFSTLYPLSLYPSSFLPGLGLGPGLYMCAYPEHLLYTLLLGPPEPFVEYSMVLIAVCSGWGGRGVPCNSLLSSSPFV